MKRLFTLLLIFALCFPCYASENKWHGTKPPPGSQIDWSHPLSKGLVGAWLMNEGGGNRINDLTSKSNGRFDSVFPVWKSTIKGYSLDFSTISVNRTVRIPTNPSLKIANNFTASFLVYPNSSVNNDGIMAGQTSGRGADDWSVGVLTGGAKIFFQVFTGANPYLQADFTKNTWNHIVCTLDTSNYGKIYINGKFGVGGALETMGTSAVEFIIGNYTPGATTAAFNGYVSHVYVWNRILTPSEILSLYIDPYQFIKKPNWGLLKAAEEAGVFVPQTQVIWFN